MCFGYGTGKHKVAWVRPGLPKARELKKGLPKDRSLSKARHVQGSGLWKALLCAQGSRKRPLSLESNYGTHMCKQKEETNKHCGCPCFDFQKLHALLFGVRDSQQSISGGARVQGRSRFLAHDWWQQCHQGHAPAGVAEQSRCTRG